MTANKRIDVSSLAEERVATMNAITDHQRTDGQVVALAIMHLASVVYCIGASLLAVLTDEP